MLAAWLIKLKQEEPIIWTSPIDLELNDLEVTIRAKKPRFTTARRLLSAKSGHSDFAVYGQKPPSMPKDLQTYA